MPNTHMYCSTVCTAPNKDTYVFAIIGIAVDATSSSMHMSSLFFIIFIGFFCVSFIAIYVSKII